MRQKSSTKTKLTNTQTNDVIVLSDGLYPVDEHNWSVVASNQQRALDGSLIIQQSLKKYGRPLTLQSPPDMGWLSRATVNKLKAERDKLAATFWLEYLADDTVRRVKVAFDTSQANAIDAKDVKGYNSPQLSDPFLVTLRFIEVGDD
ncbi:hypothetical protein [Psychrobacter pygoscelis]|uniref:hypothetical protein n=1 Tax=Psychrobacter pygoscelis TaxID=2488563 RepID=UPI0010389D08|nr:hypothetical protein [Psychrobacter pygoscelis]